MRLTHEAEDADSVHPSFQLVVDDSSEAALVNDPLVREGSRKDRENTLKAHEAHRV